MSSFCSLFSFLMHLSFLLCFDEYAVPYSLFYRKRPSELLSFAVIDFSSTGRAKDYLSVLFKVMQSHGMPLPCNVNLTRALERVYFTQRESREPCFPDTPGGVSLFCSQWCKMISCIHLTWLYLFFFFSRRRLPLLNSPSKRRKTFFGMT